jgi:hypothetical protein
MQHEAVHVSVVVLDWDKTACVTVYRVPVALGEALGLFAPPLQGCGRTNRVSSTPCICNMGCMSISMNLSLFTLYRQD